MLVYRWSAGKLLEVDAAHIVETASLHTRGIRVVLYTQAACQYCQAAKKYLGDAGIAYHEYSVGRQVSIATVAERVGRVVSKVPQIFVDGVHVGGNFGSLMLSLTSSI